MVAAARRLVPLLLALVILRPALSQSDDEPALAINEKATMFVVEHSLGPGGGFTDRSEVEVQLSKQSKSITAKVLEPSYRFSAAEATQFRALVASDGFYSVRVRTEGGAFVVASVRACALQRDWHEIINFHVDKDGALLAMDFAAPFDQRPCGGVGITAGGQIKLTSMAKLKLPQDAPAVPTFQGPAPGVPQPAGAKKVGKDGKEVPPEQSQSFIRKYWYIIVPVVLMSMLQSPAEEEDKGGGKGGKAIKGGGGGGGKKKR